MDFIYIYIYKISSLCPATMMDWWPGQVPFYLGHAGVESLWPWTKANKANEWIISAGVNNVYQSPVAVVHLDPAIQDSAWTGALVTRHRRTHRHRSPLGLGSIWSRHARATCPYYCLWQNQEGNASSKSACVVPARQILLAVPPM